MKKILIFIPLLFSLHAFSQQWGLEKDRLTGLLKERKDTFEIYFENIEKRSGIFGNQTKGDVKKVNEILTDIVKTDNIIFKELYRLLDYEKFEKNVIGGDVEEYENKVGRLVAANDTLSKQITALRVQNSNIQHRNKINKVLRNLFGVFTLLLLLYIVVKKTKPKVKL